jgi:hypothetical protein
MKKIITIAKEFGPSIAALALPALAFAQIQPPSGFTGSNVPQSGVSNLSGVLSSLCAIFSWAFIGLLVLAGIFIIVAAFRYLTAAGDPEKVKGAGTMLLYTAIAIAVALLARAVPLVIASFLGTSVQGFTC